MYIELSTDTVVCLVRMIRLGETRRSLFPAVVTTPLSLSQLRKNGLVEIATETSLMFRLRGKLAAPG